MARARRRAQTSVSLFPFLSVLACVIGALTLLITAAAIGQVATDTVDLEHYQKLERSITRDREQLATLSTLSEELATLDADILLGRDEKRGMSEAWRRALDQLQASAPLREEVRVASLALQGLKEQLRGLDAEVRARRRELERARAARAETSILIQPTGSGYGMDPHFAECRGEGLVLYEGSERRPAEVNASNVSTSALFRRFLRRVRGREAATLVFLIRPGGVHVCADARRMAGEMRIAYGEIPVPGEGAFDFSSVDAGIREQQGR